MMAYYSSLVYLITTVILSPLVTWHEIPSWMTLADALLTLSSWVYILYRDQTERSGNAAQSREKAIATRSL
jgi:hypothetical protein